MSAPEESAADQFIRIFKDLVRPTLALRLPDFCFQAGHELELKKRITEVVDERIASATRFPLGKSYAVI